MKSLNSLSYHVSGLSAKTVEASAHAPSVVVSGFREWDIASQHAESLFSYPLSLSASRGNPYSGFTSSVNNCESPLGFEFDNIGIGNQLGSERVYNLYNVIPENKFRFYPNCKGNSNQYNTNQEFEDDLKCAGIDRKTVSSKKRDQYDRNSSPYKITSGAKSFIHMPIIAGETQ